MQEGYLTMYAIYCIWEMVAQINAECNILHVEKKIRLEYNKM